MIQEEKLSQKSYLVAVVGAGPAGLFAARQLASAGVQVVLLNRDIKPGGLAEYGIYYDKHKMKEGLRKQFRQILENSNLTYLGNVSVGISSGLGLDDLHEIGFQAVLVTVGAQGTKLLGIPGEELRGVYHAKDIVYHYNQLPPFSHEDFWVCCRVALIGVGNVMLDIAHWAIRDLKVDEVIAIARRGPAEVKFSKNEMEYVARNLDLEALDNELARVAPIMESVGQDVQASRDYILAALPKALDPVSNTHFRFEFLASPTCILGDELGNVIGLEIEDTTLVPAGSDTRARGLGTHRVLDVESVIFCIGDKVDDTFGLPIKGSEFIKNPDPRYPINGISYEVYDPEAGKPIEGVFVAGWSREASSGLVGMARKDGENSARAILQFLQTMQPLEDTRPPIDILHQKLERLGRRIITKHDIWILEEIERMEARHRGLEFYKMKSNEEMLNALESN
jgi:ferredoxin/flavodoxin---NADP+ reductase